MRLASICQHVKLQIKLRVEDRIAAESTLLVTPSRRSGAFLTYELKYVTNKC